MKQSLVIFLFICSLFPAALSGQNDSIQRKVKKVIVYAECKNKQTNQDLMACFSEKMRRKLENQILYYDQGKLLESYKIQKASATISFLINKQGKIVKVDYLKVSHPIFKEIIENTLSDVVSKLKEIKPAIDMDGNLVNLLFQFTVNYQIPKESLWENETFAFQKFPQAREVVYAVLEVENKIYEIRLDRNYQIKIHEKTNAGYIFLGTFSDLYEVESIEPYRTLIQNTEISGKHIKADGMIGNKHCQVLYDANDRKIKIYENSNWIKSYGSFSKFIKSSYAELILRK